MDQLDRRPGNVSDAVVGRAIRAVERQLEADQTKRSGGSKNTAFCFFDLLDHFQHSIFSTVEVAASSNLRSIYLSSVPGFTEQADAVFDLGLGMVDAGLLNEWLRRRDLAHIFKGTSFTIEW